MQSESLTQTHPPAGGAGCPGSATTDTLLPCGLSKTPNVIHHTQRDLRQRTLRCRLLSGRGGASTFAQDLLFQILLPGPPFLLALVCGNRGNGTSERSRAEDQKNAVFNRQLNETLAREQMRDVTSLPLQQVPQCRSNQPSIFKICCRVHLERLRDGSSKVWLQKT